MRIQGLRIATLLTSVASPCFAQTRADADSANALRRCAVERAANESGEQFAIRCAERFVAEQGYTARPLAIDTTRIVAEGIEWSSLKSEWLSRRRGTLEARAAGVCVNPDGRYTVVFRGPQGEDTRGVTLDATFGSLRMEHQSFRFEVVEKRQYGCRSVPARGSR
jgi:hypothetical protein